MRIVLTGGGTGGHIFPLVAVAKKIMEKDPGSEILYIGPPGKLEEEAMESIGIEAKKILVGKMRRYFSFKNFIDFFKVIGGFFQSLYYLFVYMPDVIFAKGGYVSIPVVLAGWTYRIPIMIHESDAAPGLANSILGKFSERIAIAYPEAEKEFVASKAVLTGNPLREDINRGSAQAAREKFSLTESKKVIFIWGGSQGAQAINDRILHILPDLLKRYQVIHQTGERNFDSVRQRAGELGFKAGREGYHPIGFIKDELKDILAVSDLVISRAGANSIAEIAANRKPSILIPLESAANDHQRMNAYSVARSGGCLVLEENNLGENLLLSRINEIMDDQELRDKLSRNIAPYYHPDAVDRIIEGIEGIAK